VNNRWFTTTPSPIGQLLLTANDEGLTGLYSDPSEAQCRGARSARAPFQDALAQVEAYWGGELTDFEVSLAPQGTEWQTRVWRALRDISFGDTTTYAELAERVGRPGAARAVGSACGRNPVAIIVPCHRVVGRNGSLVGYAGGLGRKRLLLEHERAAQSGATRSGNAEDDQGYHQADDSK
jgi:methylated-DNA-[protein]-cysteine S-methyltransferase